MKELLNQFLDSSRKMQNVYITVFIVALTLLRITIEIYTSDSDPTLAGYLAGNLLPELSGMIIELFVLLFIIEAIQSSERKRQKELLQTKVLEKQVMLERRLRAQLRFLLRRVFHDVKYGDDEEIITFLFHATEHEKNQQTLDNLKLALSANIESKTFLQNLIKTCESELPLLLSLSPVCSQLSDRHVKAWMSIAFYLNQIVSENEPHNNADKLIGWIAYFDKQTDKQSLFL
ncbi:hypothetical protein [Aliivibrio fischeri]|uniref:hypothetical protein n=1 Tax=Aliivibrio fischeri TaxID=668 RepID=UPI001432C0B8|nr:hypothetical protein [Aliivibrio fischeri]